VNSHGVFMVHKTTQRSLYDGIAAANPHVDDVLLWNHEGEVVESCRANLLFRVGARWYTPPLASGGLPGVGRAALLADGAVAERVLRVDELATVDELRLVSALRGSRSVRLVDGAE
jgi:para-aminobenzoate synthetase/4-amino-4-deoxychorismate lyase